MLLLLALVGCAAPMPRGAYRVDGKTYSPLARADGYTEEGIASWYGADFHGRKTSSGEVYDMNGRTAAHKLLPLGTTVRVTNLENGKAVLTRINDRGPFVDGRIIDLTYTLARDLGMAGQGLARVRVEAVSGPGGLGPPGPILQGPFAWQVGSFSVRANARSLAEALRGSLGDVTVEEYDRGDIVFHRVRVGTFRTVQEADEVLASLRSRGIAHVLVRRD